MFRSNRKNREIAILSLNY